jgi:hypothetical protein
LARSLGDLAKLAGSFSLVFEMSGVISDYRVSRISPYSPEKQRLTRPGLGEKRIKR